MTVYNFVKKNNKNISKLKLPKKNNIGIPINSSVNVNKMKKIIKWYNIWTTPMNIILKKIIFKHKLQIFDAYHALIWKNFTIKYPLKK